MKTFIVACVAAIIIAVIGVFALNSVQEPVDQAFSTRSVRHGACALNHQNAVREKPDPIAGRDARRLLGKLQQAVGLRQRR
jgi:hypothetical protein